VPGSIHFSSIKANAPSRLSNSLFHY